MEKDMVGTSTGKLKSISIDILDDGTFLKRCNYHQKSGKNGGAMPYQEGKQYSYQTVKDLLEGLEEELE